MIYHHEVLQLPKKIHCPVAYHVKNVLQQVHKVVKISASEVKMS